MGKGRLLWFRKLLPLNSLQRAYCFCIIIPNVSKSAFSQYLKHSQLAHKYHLYSCIAIQHIRNIIYSVLRLHSLIIWANAYEPKIKTKRRVQSSPSRIMEILYLFCQGWPKTQGHHVLCTWRVARKVSWPHARSRTLLLGNSTVDEQLAPGLAFSFIFIYLLCTARGLSCVSLKNKTNGDLMRRMSLFRNSQGITIRDMQAIANQRQVRRGKGGVSFYYMLGGNQGRLF